MMMLGSHPVIRPLLENILDDQRSYLRKYALKRGVRQEDADDVIQEAYLAVYHLQPEKDIQALAQHWTPSLPNRVKLSRMLIALFVYYLRLKCRDYLGQAAANQARYESLDEQVEKGRSPLLDGADLRAVLANAGLSHLIDVDLLEQGDAQTREAFCEVLAAQAGLTAAERDFLLFRAQHPEARDQDFDPLLRPDQITRIKQPAFEKIRILLGIAGGQRMSRERKRSCNNG